MISKSTLNHIARLPGKGFAFEKKLRAIVSIDLDIID